MSRSSICWKIVALLLILGPVAAVGFAADKPEAKPKYKITIHTKDGKENVKAFDPDNEDHQRELQDGLKAGADDEVHNLERETKVNLLDISWDLGLWTLVVFLLLYFILKKVAWAPMLEGLHKREENIASAIEEARKAREEAANLRTFLEQERAKIAEDVRLALDEARADGRRLVEEMQGRAKAEIQADRDRLRHEIETARDQAIHELWTQAANLATLISAKAIGRELNPDDHRRLVDEAIGELSTANVGWKDRTLY